MATSPRHRRSAGFSAFAGLLVLGTGACLLPPHWMGCVRTVSYPLVWLQSAVGGGSRAIRRAASRRTSIDPSRSEYRALARHNAQMERQLQHQSIAITQLRRQVEELSGLRSILGDRRTRLIPAAVVAYDPSPRRETLVLDVGSNHTTERARIRPGQWVAAWDGVDVSAQQRNARAALSRQWLIGRIIEVGPLTSRVLLATDSRFGPIRVRTAKVLADGALALAMNPETRKPRFCLLDGRGRGRMIIRQAISDDFRAGWKGVLVPAGAELPAAMLIGRVIASESVDNAPLVFDLTVEPFLPVSQITHVVVISTGS